jgi:hypothetical protein
MSGSKEFKYFPTELVMQIYNSVILKAGLSKKPILNTVTKVQYVTIKDIKYILPISY